MKKYQGNLSEEERQELQRMVRSGCGSARAIRRAQVLLKSDEGWSERTLAEAFGVSRQTVHGVRKRGVEAGAQQPLPRKPGRKAEKVLEGAAEAHLIALTCSEPPAGQDRGTLRLLARRRGRLGYVPALSHESVRRALKKMD